MLRQLDQQCLQMLLETRSMTLLALPARQPQEWTRDIPCSYHSSAMHNQSRSINIPIYDPNNSPTSKNKKSPPIGRQESSKFSRGAGNQSLGGPWEGHLPPQRAFRPCCATSPQDSRATAAHGPLHVVGEWSSDDPSASGGASDAGGACRGCGRDGFHEIHRCFFLYCIVVFFLILFRNMFWWVGTPNLGVCVSSKSLKWGRWSAVYAVETSAFNQFPALFSRYLQASFFLRTWTVTKCNLVKVVILWWFFSDREHLNSLWHVFFSTRNIQSVRPGGLPAVRTHVSLMFENISTSERHIETW